MKPMFLIAFLALCPAIGEQLRPTPIPSSARAEIVYDGRVCDTDGAEIRATAWLPAQERWAVLCNDRAWRG